MKSVELKNFGKPDEVREFAHGKIDVLKLTTGSVGKAVLQPGWRWSTSVKPIAKTESCQCAHLQYHVSGVLRVRFGVGCGAARAPCRHRGALALQDRVDEIFLAQTAITVDSER